MLMRVVNDFRSLHFVKNVFASEIKGRFASTAAADVERKKTSAKPRMKPKVVNQLSKSELEEALLAVSKPKRSASGYGLFVTDFMKQMKANNESIKLQDVSQKISEQWKNLSAQEKSKYEKQAQLQYESNPKNSQKNRDNYETLMNSIVKVKDAIAVFKSLLEQANIERKLIKRVTAMGLFMHDQSLNEKYISFDEMHKRWTSLDERTKTEYERKAEKMNAQTTEAIDAWKEKYFFLN